MSRIKKFCKYLLIHAFPARRFDKKRIRKVLWISSHGHFGDRIQGTMLPREIKKIYPSAEIYVAAQKEFFCIFENNGDVSGTIVLPDGLVAEGKPGFSPPGLYALYRVVKEFDIVVDFPDGLPWYALFVYFFAGVKHVYQNDEACLSSCFVTFTETDFSRQRMYTFKRLLENMGAKAPDMSGSINPDEESSRYVCRFIKDKGLGGKKLIVFNPEAATRTKTLSVCKVKEIATGIMNKLDWNWALIIVYYDMLYDIGAGNIYPVNVRDMGVLFSFIRSADYIISVDTASVHIADIFRKPMLCLYSYWYGPRDRAVNGIFWHSNQDGTITFKADTVNDIPTEDIVNSAVSAIKELK